MMYRRAAALARAAILMAIALFSTTLPAQEFTLGNVTIAGPKGKAMVSIFAVWTGALLLAPAWAGAAGDTAHDAHAGHRTRDARAPGGELVVPIYLISAEGVHESIGTITPRDGPDGLSVIPDLRGIEPGRHALRTCSMEHPA